MPKAVSDFLRQPNSAVIGCIRPDGYPMTVVTWYDWDGGRILVNMSSRRARLGWMRRNRRVSLTVSDNWHRHVSLFGDVVELRDDEDLADIDRLARRYTGEPFFSRNDPRVSAWIQPVGWHIWDPAGELT